MVLRSSSGRAACLQASHLIIPSALYAHCHFKLIFFCCPLCGVVIIVYECTWATVAGGFCYM